jgi:phage terminase large subunit GpA-like protein
VSVTKQAFDIFASAADAAIPQGGVTVSDWADMHRILSPEASAEPGRWRTSRVPYARAWMDVITEPTVHTVVLKTSSQVGKSEVLNNACGYFIHHDPCPILLIQPTVDRMKDYSKKRIQPMLRDTPVLAAVMSDDKSRDSDNTMLSKAFVGGHLLMAGANAASGLASNPIRVVLADEVDRYPRDVDNEGDPLTLAIRRATTFSNRKIVPTSTPTIKGESRIEELFNTSHGFKYHVPCPHCGTFQVLRWRDVIERVNDKGEVEVEHGDYRVQWELDEDGNIKECYYVCEQGCLIEPHHKLWMISAESGAEWRDAEGESLDAVLTAGNHKGSIGFAINALNSPWFHWHEIIAEFLVAIKAAKEGKPELLKVFVNTLLGETWDTNQEGSDIKGLEQREEEYSAEIPLGVLCLTAGVDTQPDRLECEIVGWGIGEESWSINYYVIRGDTNQPQVWQQLFEVLSKSYECEREDSTGTRLTRTIDACCIDSGGHNTQAVYAFTKAHSGRKWLAIKGSSTAAKETISMRPTKLKGGALLYIVGTNLVKDKLFGYLKVTEPGAAYCHFPAGYDDEYYKQLTAEKRVKKIKKFDKNDPHGYSQWMYKKIRSRNEALDCRVYAMAALYHLNFNFPRALEQENLHCAAKTDTLYVSENAVKDNNESFVRRFGQTQGFVSKFTRQGRT